MKKKNRKFLWLYIMAVISIVSGCVEGIQEPEWAKDFQRKYNQEPVSDAEQEYDSRMKSQAILKQPSVRAAGEFMGQELYDQWLNRGKPSVLVTFFKTADGTRNKLCQQLEDHIANNLKCSQTYETYEELKKYWKPVKNDESDSQKEKSEILNAQCLITGKLYKMENEKVIEVLIKGVDTRTNEGILSSRCYLNMNNIDVEVGWHNESDFKIYSGIYAQTDQGTVDYSRSNQFSMKSFQGFTIYIEPTETAYIYMADFDSRGNGTALFPNQCPKGFADNPIPAGQTFRFPQGDTPYQLDDRTGKEEIFIFASRTPRPDIEHLLYNLTDVCLNKVVAPSDPAKKFQEPSGGYRVEASGNKVRGIFKQLSIKGMFLNSDTSIMTTDGGRISKVRAQLLKGSKGLVSRRFVIDHH
ncbi:DUF4384 domain-containing protein [Desulfobacterales bacterium HSG16]|nr:DUF4384 domain-containing protein [Desulfobacterales bacterium HSG16]